MTVTVSDLFCGAGGSSLGAEAAGMTLRLAMNHWERAIEVHQHHFPDAVHDVVDISQADPRRYPNTDILLASPECTNHSQARGVSRKKQDQTLWDMGDPAAERSRATMWDVPRFAEQHRYAAIVVENVVEATKWVMWPAWWQAMELLGYQGRILSHNSQDHGVAQSRDRIYVVWTRKGLAPNLEMERRAWCPRCERTRVVRQSWKNGRTVGRYRTQWVWACGQCNTVCEPSKTPAAEIIDWKLDAPRIGDRERPLSKNTRRRIAAGLERYWGDPFATSILWKYKGVDPNGMNVSVDEPLPTQMTKQSHALTVPSFMFNTAHGGRSNTLEDPHPTICASDDRQSLITGFLMRNNTAKGDPSNLTTPVTEPARTMTTTGHQSLLLPYYSQSHCQTVDVPIGTQSTRDTHALINAEELVDDCGFRMLEPYEVAAAMAFPRNYIPRTITKKDQVKLAGNAVTPPVMQWICGRLVQALES